MTESNELTFRKSTFSDNTGGCAEVAFAGDGSVHVRDTKDPLGSTLVFTPDEWLAFTRGVRAGEFDQT